ncbi:hypothetical protein, partial [Streptococcus agalactiae]
MKKKNLLQESINKRLSEERYQIPKEKREKKRFDMQLILIISILIGLIMSIIGIIRFFLTYSLSLIHI